MQVGMIGAGLMGHGIALNILKGGFSVVVMEHSGNQPINDLIDLGAKRQSSPARVAAETDLIIVCVTGSPEVEEVIAGKSGITSALKPGAIVIDCSTALPDSTVRMAELVFAAGGEFLDAPMTRLAQQAHDGTLNILVGGKADVLETARPVLNTFTENINHVGEVGFGHRMKLLHNYVSIGYMALLSEAAAQAAQAGIQADVFIDVLAKGGGAGSALERLKSSILTGDSSSIPFTINNAIKDIDYYREMIQNGTASKTIADGISVAIKSVVKSGDKELYLSELTKMFRK